MLATANPAADAPAPATAPGTLLLLALPVPPHAAVINASSGTPTAAAIFATLLVLATRVFIGDIVAS
ncbi:MAG: hypothetical protein ABI468_08550 [Candidatus Nanopelagicales bacterium]